MGINSNCIDSTGIGNNVIDFDYAPAANENLCLLAICEDSAVD
jgi:hypothetical protein